MGFFLRIPLVFLEIKGKKNNVCRKFRITLSPEAEKELITQSRLTLSDSLIATNSDLKLNSLEKRVKKIRKMIRKYQLVPQVQIRYRRRAYEKDGIRMTIDSNIQSRYLRRFYPQVADHLVHRFNQEISGAHHHRFSSSANCVAEIKHTGSIPQWAQELMQAMGIEECRFSKYCWGIIQKSDFFKGGADEPITLASAQSLA